MPSKLHKNCQMELHLDHIDLHVFFKKLRIKASTQSFLKLLNFKYSEFRMSFLKVL